MKGKTSEITITIKPKNQENEMKTVYDIDI